MASILVVDDDQKLLRMLRRTLSYEGFTVLTATNGEDAIDLILQHRPDAVVLDWMMPGLAGIDVVSELREAADQTPILMLTARDAVSDRVTGLDGGADDYLIKPFEPSELLARVRALLRRSLGANPSDPLICADLSLNPVSREVRRGHRDVALTPKEFDLLQHFLRHPNQVLTRDNLLVEIWGYDFDGDDNVLEVYIGYLRRKTEADNETRLIHTVRGVGYVLREG